LPVCNGIEIEPSLSEKDKKGKNFIIENTTARTTSRGGLVRRTGFSAVADKASLQKTRTIRSGELYLA